MRKCALGSQPEDLTAAARRASAQTNLRLIARPTDLLRTAYHQRAHRQAHQQASVPRRRSSSSSGRNCPPMAQHGLVDFIAGQEGRMRDKGRVAGWFHGFPSTAFKGSSGGDRLNARRGRRSSARKGWPAMRAAVEAEGSKRREPGPIDGAVPALRCIEGQWREGWRVAAENRTCQVTRRPGARARETLRDRG